MSDELITGILADETWKGSKQEGLKEKIASMIEEYELDIFLGPEYLFMPEQRIYTRSEKEEICQYFADKSKETGCLIIPGTIMWQYEDHFYNTTPIIYNGNVVEKHKSIDAGDSDLAKERGCQKALFTDNTQNIVEWNGLKIGLEICREAGKLPESAKLDIYVLVAAGLSLDGYLYDYRNYGFELPVKEGKYALNSNGSQLSESQVYQKKGRENKVISSTKEGNISIYRLKI